MSVKKPALVEEDLFDLFASLDPEPEEPADTPAPKNQKEPLFLDCGHLNFSSSEAQVTARAEGFCCVAGRNVRAPVNWMLLKGDFRRPIPKRVWRSAEKEKSGGFPGLCVDAAGYYIGGVGNDCRYYRPEGSEVCSHHQVQVA